MTEESDERSAQSCAEKKRVCDDEIIPVPDKIRDCNSE